MSSCFRIPVAPATLRSFATWVSFWMLISFSSEMLSPSPPFFWGSGAGLGASPAGAGWGAAAAAGGCPPACWSGAWVSAVEGSGACAAWPLDARGVCGCRLW